MKSVVIFFTLLAIVNAKSLSLTWEESESDESKSPVQRVVSLLKRMEEQLAKEAAGDDEIYEQLVCWCDTNRKGKEEASSEAQAKIAQLEAEIEERTAAGAKLRNQIDHLAKDIKEDKDSLAKAEANREGEAGKFTKEEKEMVQAMMDLKNAITVLSKHNAGLIQMDPVVIQSLGSCLRAASEKHKMMTSVDKMPTILLSLKQSEKPIQLDQHRMLRAIESNASDVMKEKYASRVLASFAQQPVAASSYNNQSGEIFGILNQMLDEFKANVSDSQKAELAAQEAFQQLKAAKLEEIETATNSRNNKRAEEADNSAKLANAKEDLEDTRNQLSDDKKFMLKLKLQCNDIDNQFQLRSKTRADEMAAVADAIKILTEDDNREHLAKTTFLQRDINVDNDDLDLEIKANNMKQQLSTLSTKAQLDSFTRVKTAMDKMVAEMKRQQSDEVAHRDFCLKEFNKNDRENKKNENKHEDLVNNIQVLESSIEQLTNEIAAANKEIASLRKNIKIASEDREKENAEFQVVINEQRESQAILNKALARLKAFYAKGSFLQHKADPQAPVQFKAYNNNAGANPVLTMIQKVIEDSQATVNEAMADEQESQKNYQSFVSESNGSISNLMVSINNKAAQKAQNTVDKETANKDRQSTENELQLLHEYRQELHGSCDFVLKNFEVRQKSRADQMESIRQAKAILSGSQ